MMDAVLKVEVPPSMTRPEAEDRRASMTSRGLTTWSFTWKQVTRFAREGGYEEWLREGGYDPETAEAAWVEFSREEPVALFLSARKAVECHPCGVNLNDSWPACPTCGVCLRGCCRCKRGNA